MRRRRRSKEEDTKSYDVASNICQALPVLAQHVLDFVQSDDDILKARRTHPRRRRASVTPVVFDAIQRLFHERGGQQLFLELDELQGLGSVGCCSPRRRTHFKPSWLERTCTL